MSWNYYNKNKCTQNSTANPVTTSILSQANTTLIVLCVSYTGTTARTGGAPDVSGYDMIQAGTVESCTEGSVELWYTLNEHITKSVGLTINLPNANTRTINTISSSYYTAAGEWALFTVVDQASDTGSSNPITVTVGLFGNVDDVCVVASMFSGYDSLLAGGWSFNGTLLYGTDNGTDGNAGNFFFLGGGFHATSQAMTYTTKFADDWAITGAAFTAYVEPVLGKVNTVLYQDIQDWNTTQFHTLGGAAKFETVQELNTVVVPISPV